MRVITAIGPIVRVNNKTSYFIRDKELKFVLNFEADEGTYKEWEHVQMTFTVESIRDMAENAISAYSIDKDEHQKWKFMKGSLPKKPNIDSIKPFTISFDDEDGDEPSQYDTVLLNHE